ncbi:MAG: trypsin-like peptidase domain-containing protein [Actinobacteria bacterium]|nr:trypsin-like peptidase domain-containing protein [Actinomycetota bacterium]
MSRPGFVAVIAIVSAFLGGTSALGVAKAVGWVAEPGETETIVVGGSDADAAAPVDETQAPPESTGEPLPGNDFDAARIYSARADGVVTIYALFGSHGEDGGGDAAQGSGFVVSDEGYILTNSHVVTTAGDTAADDVEAATTTYVEFRDGDRVPAKIIGWDPFDDVGLVKVAPGSHELDPVPLGDSGDVVVGQPVAAIGSPFGQLSSLSVGVVSATERSIASLTSEYNLVDAIQTDAPINRGNSGGPLLDARGRAIGINAQIRSESGTAEGVGFAVPINSAIRSMRQLIDEGRVRYAWVGVSTQTLTPALARRFDYAEERGAVVQSVVPRSPAAEAGLRAGGSEEEFTGIEFRPGGDLIVAIDGTEVDSAEDVVREVTRRSPGETLRLTIWRGDERHVVPVELGERPMTPPDTSR